MSLRRLARLLSVPQRSITSLTRDNSRRSQKRFLNYEVIQPAKVLPAHYVPSHIVRPDYAQTGLVGGTPGVPEIKTKDQILRVAEACQLARLVLDTVGAHAQEGITTEELDRLAHELCVSKGAYPSPLNYRWYPKSICTSVNNVACHGIPDERKLKDGDIISIDVSVFYNGYHGDCAETFGVGRVDERGWNLIETARYCLQAGIVVCRDGEKLSAIGQAIEKCATESNCSVIPYFCGHGIGTYFHGPPDIFHFDNDSEEVMRAGMTFTIEPVISEGGSDIMVLEDGWTAITSDQSRSAQFEHTILVTLDGSRVLTSSPREF